LNCGRGFSHLLGGEIYVIVNVLVVIESHVVIVVLKWVVVGGAIEKRGREESGLYAN
jgi:hypothetical protein